MAIPYGTIPIIGETILAQTDGTTANETVVYTPWFARHGDAFTSVLEIIAISGSTTLKYEVLHKNGDDTGGGVRIGVVGTKSNTGVNNFRREGLKELVRYKFTLTDNSPAGAKTLYIHYRMLAPSWELNGAQAV